MLKGRTCVGVAKRLCGSATDLALNAFVGLVTRGVAVATCCHHRCEWSSHGPRLLPREDRRLRGGLRADRAVVVVGLPGRERQYRGARGAGLRRRPARLYIRTEAGDRPALQGFVGCGAPRFFAAPRPRGGAVRVLRRRAVAGELAPRGRAPVRPVRRTAGSAQVAVQPRVAPDAGEVCGCVVIQPIFNVQQGRLASAPARNGRRLGTERRPPHPARSRRRASASSWAAWRGGAGFDGSGGSAADGGAANASSRGGAGGGGGASVTPASAKNCCASDAGAGDGGAAGFSLARARAPRLMM